MVEVRVRDEDRLDLRDAQVIDRSEQLLGLVTGVDDHRSIVTLLAHQEAVLLDGADGEHPDVDHRAAPPPCAAAFLR